MLGGFAGSAQAGGPIVVNSAADPGDGVCNEAECTLREALTAAHGIPGPNTIHFNIPGPGPHSISPLTQLPGSVQPLTVDATTEPDYEGSPVVEINGQNVEEGLWHGLSLDGGGSVVRGLVVNNWSSDGIRFAHGGGNSVEECHVGTDISGMFAMPNGANGILFASSSDNVVVGNLVSGNTLDGIRMSNSSRNVIQGNLIGTDITGTTGLGNGYSGIDARGAQNLVGGTQPGQSNLISGNGLAGVRFSESDAAGGMIFGNRIGTDATGNLPIPNAGDGVDIVNNAHDTTVGGDGDGEANLIAFNGRAGVRIQSGIRNAVSANSIHDNGRTGILLGSAGGFTANDPGDGDEGPNDLQNFPVIESATNEVTLTLDSLPDREYRVEVFANETCDTTGHGEGETYLGFVDASTGADGQLEVTAPFPGLEEAAYVTATATDPAGNTSEFSACLPAGGGIPLFEGWNPLVWPGPTIGTVEEVIGALDVAVEPDAWDSVAYYSDGWLQTFRDAPLPGFNTLTELQPDRDIWLFLNEQAEFFPPAAQ